MIGTLKPSLSAALAALGTPLRDDGPAFDALRQRLTQVEQQLERAKVRGAQAQAAALERERAELLVQIRDHSAAGSGVPAGNGRIPRGGDASGHIRGLDQDRPEFDAAMRMTTAERGVKHGDSDELVTLIRDIQADRSAQMTPQQRRILAAALGVGEGKAVEQFTRDEAIKDRMQREREAALARAQVRQYRAFGRADLPSDDMMKLAGVTREEAARLREQSRQRAANRSAASIENRLARGTTGSSSITTRDPETGVEQQIISEERPLTEEERRALRRKLDRMKASAKALLETA